MSERDSHVQNAGVSNTSLGESSSKFRGNMDALKANVVFGWVDDPAYGKPLPLEVIVNRSLRARIVADVYRGDVEKAGVADGKRGYQLSFNPPLSRKEKNTVEVRCELNGRHVPGSPKVLECEPDAKDVVIESNLSAKPEKDASVKPNASNSHSEIAVALAKLEAPIRTTNKDGHPVAPISDKARPRGFFSAIAHWASKKKSI